MKNENSILRVNINDLEELYNIYHFQGKPFTGIYYGLYPNGNLLIENETLNGKNHGICNMYKGDGTIYTQVNFNNGEINNDDIDKQTEFVRYMTNEVYLQKEIEKKKLNGLKQTYYDNGQLETEGEYKNGKMIGLWKYYYENGQLQSEGNFKEDEVNGIWKSYHENGQLSEEKVMEDGIKSGYIKSWFESGKLHVEGDFNKGHENGLWKFYHESGRLHVEGNFIMGNKDGVWKCWYDSGGLEWVTNKKNDKRDGVRKTFYENGQLNIEENYNNDKLEGNWKSYHDNGQLQSEGIYNDGKKNGLWKCYTIDGKLNFKEKFKNGKEDGWSKYKNVNDYVDYNNIKFVNDNLDEIIDLDFKKENIELYFGYKYEYRGSVFQCIKSEKNKFTEIISEYDEDQYVREGNDDSEYIKEMFDETNEIHEGWSYSVWLCKINSEDFKTKIKDKIQEWSDSKDDEYFYLSEFLEWLEYDDYGVHTLENVYEHLGGDLNDLESVLDEEDIDETGNCISWYSYFQLDEEYLQIGYRKVEDK